MNEYIALRQQIALIRLRGLDGYAMGPLLDELIRSNPEVTDNAGYNIAATAERTRIVEGLRYHANCCHYYDPERAAYYNDAADAIEAGEEGIL